MESHFHDPVLEEPLLELLRPLAGGVYLDANLGGGSHSLKILERLHGSGRVLGIDLDPAALQAAREKLRDHPNFSAAQANFSELAAVLEAEGLASVQGVIFDLGVSSHQLDRPERGFSFRAEGPLDMRFDPQAPVSAEDLVNDLSERELERIIKEYGEERWAGPIARKIVQRRQHARLTSTRMLASLVEEAIPRKFHPPRIHPATRTFQALRIAVNRELESLEAGLAAAIDALAPGGRIVCIAYHSLEDRIVKRSFLSAAGRAPERPPGLPRGLPPPPSPPPRLRLLTRSPMGPEAAEIARNPRARSARLRAAEKLPG